MSHHIYYILSILLSLLFGKYVSHSFSILERRCSVCDKNSRYIDQLKSDSSKRAGCSRLSSLHFSMSALESRLNWGHSDKYSIASIGETKCMNSRTNEISTSANLGMSQKYLTWSSWELSGSRFDDDMRSEEEQLQLVEIKNSTIQHAIKELEASYITHIDTTQNSFNCKDLLDIIEDHYVYRDVPFTIVSSSGISFDFNPGLSINSITRTQGELLSKILSFAVITSISKEVTAFLLELVVKKFDNEGNPYLSRSSIDAFRSGGWNAVKFPSGLSLLVRRKYLKSNRERFFPLPRRFWNSRAIDDAQIMIAKAAKQSPPITDSIGDMKSIFESVDVSGEISVRSLFANMKSETDKWKREMKLYFPKQNMFYKKLKVFFNRRADALKSAGRAGLISYGFLNLAWYTFALIFSWKRVAGTSYVPIGVSRSFLMQNSLRKFMKVLAVVYVGSQITKLPRLCLAVISAPVGDLALKWLEKKFQISEGKSTHNVAITHTEY